MSNDVDAVIVGGGPAGASAACHLSRAGARAVLFEREKAPRTSVCGEFLSPAATAELARLGLDANTLGAARLDRIRIVNRNGQAEAPSPFPAWGLSREILDEQLLARAARAGVEVRRGIPVRGLRRVRDGWQVLLADGTSAEARLALLATGKHDLRGHRRAPPAIGAPIGLKMHWRLRRAQAAALAGHIELVWFEGGYAGLQPIDGGLANLGLVIDTDDYRRLGKSWDALLARLEDLAPHLCARLKGAEPAAPAPAAVAGMPYGYVHAPSDDLPGLYRIGDQFAVIASFTGEGMALALRTGWLAAAAVMQGAPAPAYHAAARAEVRPAVERAGRIARLAEHPLTHALFMRGCRAWPSVLTGLARRTRLSPGASTPSSNQLLSGGPSEITHV